MGSTQLNNWSVCQICGRYSPRGTSDDWIDAPHRDGSGRRIVRCPRHWSEWALRWSIGRTNENRQRMQELQDRNTADDGFKPGVTPFPVADLSVDDQPPIGGRYGV